MFSTWRVMDDAKGELRPAEAGPQAARPKPATAREARLAKALRDNLRRRKAGERPASEPSAEG